MADQHPLLTLLLHWLVSAVALSVTAAVVPGFKLKDFKSALVAVLLIGLANTFIWPILIFLTLPLTIITLGLFIFVVDAIVLRLCAALMKGFEISGWIPAILGALVLSLTSSFLHWLAI